MRFSLTQMHYRAIAVLIVAFVLPELGFALSFDSQSIGMMGAALVGIGETDLDGLKAIIEEQGKAFEQFKATNEKRIEEIKKNDHVSAETSAKLDQIGADIIALKKEKDRLDTLEAKINRGDFGGGGLSDEDKARAEHKEGFNAYFRKGQEGNLRELEVNAALTTQVDEDGGFIVPEETDRNIERVLGTVSAMRGLATVMPVGAATYKKIVSVGGASSGWVGEEQSRSETGTPQLKGLEFPVMELYAQPYATQTMLDDGYFDIEAWLAYEVSIEFGEQEGSAFISGNGVNKPRGILSYNTVDNASYSWGKIGFVKSGANGAFAGTDPEFALLELRSALKSGYRSGSSFLMNDNTLLEIMKLKNTATGELLWRPGLMEDEPDRLLGKPVALDDNMPDISANSLSIAFANFMRTYVITDRRGTRVLRDPYTAKPYVKFYTTKRVGGGVKNYESIKLLKFAA